MEHSRITSRDKGDQGEHEVIGILKKLGITTIRRPDYCIFAKNRWISLEIKNKEPFEPPPMYMQGIPRYQYLNDLNMTHLGMPTVLIVRGKAHDWLAEYTIKLKPVPEPRTILLNDDILVWFGLNQFQTLESLAKEWIP